MDADVRRAVSMSHLRGLPTAVLAELLAGAARVTIPAGSVIHWEGENAPHLELVFSGVVRVFVTAPDGRTMTIRYYRSGALIGVMSLFAAGFTLPATIQALVDAEVLRLSPGAARRAADRGDAGVRARRTCRDRDAHRGRRAHAGRRAWLDHAQVRLARIDGADAWRSFRSITLPLLSPVILFPVITGVIAALQTFLPLLLAADSTPSGATSVPQDNYMYMINVFAQYFAHGRFGYASALLWVLFAVIVVATALIFKVTAGAVFYNVDPEAKK